MLPVTYTLYFTLSLSATYKLGKSKKTLKCNITVKNAAPAPTTAPTNVAATTTAPAAVVTTAPAATTAPTNRPTPTKRPTKSPTPEPTPKPTTMPNPDKDEFAAVPEGLALDLTTWATSAGNGIYNEELKRVEINDDYGDISQGAFTLPETVDITAKTVAEDGTVTFPGELATFRIQGYYYGTTGFRMWIGTATSGCCTPIEVVLEPDETRLVGEYPLVDADGVKKNQMKLELDPETKAFDLKFTLRAGESQNDTEGKSPNLTIKYFMDGDKDFINGLVLKNVYYIGEDYVPGSSDDNSGAASGPAITVTGQALNIAEGVALYSKGKVAYENDTLTLTKNDNGEAAGLSIDFDEPIAAGESVKVYVKGTSTGSSPRLWLSDANEAANATSNKIEKADFKFEEVFTLTATAESTRLIIRTGSASENYDSLEITSVILVEE